MYPPEDELCRETILNNMTLTQSSNQFHGNLDLMSEDYNGI